jgi:hypothetical protein
MLLKQKAPSSLSEEGAHLGFFYILHHTIIFLRVYTRW